MKDTIIEAFKKLGFDINITEIIENDRLYQIFFTCNKPLQLSKSQTEFIEREIKSPGRIIINTFIPESNELSIQVPKKSTTDKESNNPETTVEIGKTIENEIIDLDFSKFPHLLIGGTTGTGKTNIIKLILNKLITTKNEIVLVDFKLIDFINYKDKIRMIVNNESAVLEIKRFYNEMKQHQEDILNGFSPNKHYFIIIDEFAELKLDKEGYQQLRSILQMGRAFNFHVIIATQRPSANIIQGDLKANIDTRIALKVSSRIDSRIILDAGGAENLGFKGDMLIKRGTELVRVQAFKAEDPVFVPKEQEIKEKPKEQVGLKIDETFLLIPIDTYLSFLLGLKMSLNFKGYEKDIPSISGQYFDIVQRFLKVKNCYNISVTDMLIIDIQLKKHFDSVRRQIVKKRILKLAELKDFWLAILNETKLVLEYKQKIIL